MTEPKREQEWTAELLRRAVLLRHKDPPDCPGCGAPMEYGGSDWGGVHWSCHAHDNRHWSETRQCDPPGHHRDPIVVRYVNATDQGIAEAVAALRRLTNEVDGCLNFREYEMREVIGNTNMRCIQDKLSEARAALEAMGMGDE